MNWSETDTGYWEAHLDDGNDYCVISYYGKWCASYNPPDMLGGFLPNNLNIECGYGIAEAQGLQSNCEFDTKEEAQEICERHHKLLILQ